MNFIIVTYSLFIAYTLPLKIDFVR